MFEMPFPGFTLAPCPLLVIFYADRHSQQRLSPFQKICLESATAKRRQRKAKQPAQGQA